MKIIVVDDDMLVSRSLKIILEADNNIEVLAIGKNGAEAIELYNRYKPDVLLMDIRMSEMTGLEAGEQILKDDKNAKILFLTTFSDDEYIVRALNMGAKGYILKQDFDGIAAALTAVQGGQNVFGDEVITRLPELINNKEQFDFDSVGINSKEAEIIELVAAGMSNKEISTQVFLSEGTVRNYISEILEKLSLRDRTQLAVYYYRNIK